ncbi:GNAT family N-acetyltransferase [Actinomadura sp. HBU206391]|uniref:GNAT family N-acetyltransferase n=1 Tax=Actinomadura sp. HBU206391 TaxID=2731692 RepID=UPI00164F9C2F|nr:GNAT family N-acetyltransferase [Actinomadura sp. HBU206391]MBC6458118.1 GNAT family N-acetyltransferase [Actinomadura sp. HBU206391]
MLRPAYPLKTARLILRPYTPADLDALYDLQSRPEVTRYLYFGPRDRDEVREALDQKTQAVTLTDEGGNLSLAVELAETGQVIGEVILFWRSRAHRQGEVGYLFHPDHGGRGYATEATRVMLRLGFEDLGLHRIIGRIDARNTASGRVLERLGMRREAHFVQNEFVKGEWADEVVYAMLETEWRAD